MLIAAFLEWWYGAGWRDASFRLKNRLKMTYLSFSVPILLRTMFAPWRRISTPPGSSIQQKLTAVLDNVVSRAVGFVVRLMALIMGCLLLLIYSLVGGLLLILWPVLPILGPALIVGGLL
ncbi:MAG TPA: hypothetical protein VMS08_06175 [Candidatus Saccharimonadia bacterium]|nr:hypothetical protein [Candidatus Saccharimonadia bacterium]